MKLLKTAFIPVRILSQNAFMYNPNRRTNKKVINYQYKNYKDTLKQEMDKEFPKQEERPTSKRYIYLRSCKSGRKYDDANLRGGCKPVPDILQDNNWIRNDNPIWLSSEYEQVKPEHYEDEGFYLSVYEYEKTDHAAESDIKLLKQAFLGRDGKKMRKIIENLKVYVEGFSNDNE